tara:strand:+ start:109223 stop:109420 length:198 start_codon:yes stop_codon:yes gene_type:complete
MTEEQDVIRALEIARADLYFAIHHGGMCSVYNRRLEGAAEFITKTLGDKKEFSTTLDKWSKESSE